ncbi:MAG: RDD domain-containing protein [Bacteroidetes bacterium]|nr:MAG: RDD domain-containing protein [Bacteroidota bacterium]
MQSLNIQTTQNVDINYEVANIGDRLLARLIDWGIFVVLIIALSIVNASLQLSITSGLYILLISPIICYDLICEPLFQGRSFGKMVLKLRVIKIDGTQPGIGDYIIRWMFRLLEGLVAISPGLCLLVVLVNGRGQRFGDIVAGTTVISTKQKVQLRDTIMMQYNPNYVIQFPQVSMLSDRDVGLIREVLKQAMNSQNYPAIERLSARVKEVLGINPMMPSMQFLHIVLNDYTHYNFESNR